MTSCEMGHIYGRKRPEKIIEFAVVTGGTGQQTGTRTGRTRDRSMAFIFFFYKE